MIKDFNQIVDELSEYKKYDFLYHGATHNIELPSTQALTEFVAILKKILFPGYFGIPQNNVNTLKYHVGMHLDEASHLLKEQIKRGYCFSCASEVNTCLNCENLAQNKMESFIATLPDIKQKLASDVIAAFNGDPAAKNFGETIFCYPSITAMIHFRIAHELYLLDVPIIPRIITEMSHSATGIDIHPGATIGENFFIDHGTGVVIGETCIIGKNVRIYQGVTLGAKSFPLDENGKPIKGIPRHPIVEDDVTIYSNATILGRIIVGRGAVIGGNMWVTDNVEPGKKLFFKQ